MTTSTQRPRKSDTGEPTANPGHFGSKVKGEPSSSNLTVENFESGTVAKTDQYGRFHSSEGPAVVFPDGSGEFWLHGHRLPDDEVAAGMLRFFEADYVGGADVDVKGGWNLRSHIQSRYTKHSPDQGPRRQSESVEFYVDSYRMGSGSYFDQPEAEEENDYYDYTTLDEFVSDQDYLSGNVEEDWEISRAEVYVDFARAMENENDRKAVAAYMATLR